MNTRLVEVTIRPPRIATFIDAKDPHWQNTVLRIIEIYSEIWGGAYDIIVPYEYDEKEDILIIPEIFKQVLKIYDPDFLWMYTKEGLDIYLANPKEFYKYLNRLYEEKGVKRKELKEILRSNPWGNNNKQMESLHKELQTKLVDICINPFPDIYEQENKIYGISSLSIPSELNVNLSLDFLKEQCFFIQTLFNNKYLKLIVYSALGKYKPCYKKEFKKRSVMHPSRVDIF